MEITAGQIIILTIYAFFAIYDALELDLGLSRPRSSSNASYIAKNA